MVLDFGFEKLKFSSTQMSKSDLSFDVYCRDNNVITTF